MSIVVTVTCNNCVCVTRCPMFPCIYLRNTICTDCTAVVMQWHAQHVDAHIQLIRLRGDWRTAHAQAYDSAPWVLASMPLHDMTTIPSTRIAFIVEHAPNAHVPRSSHASTAPVATSGHALLLLKTSISCIRCLSTGSLTLTLAQALAAGASGVVACTACWCSYPAQGGTAHAQAYRR